ncbi:BCL-6 corepressor-like protein 1 isoform X2 [Pseudoliparis swirei]|uniref:BCL-6 corepressor-like protein 1 isoform X2 n=1 Tax=Pseudoliparis swirei TaxID=2059687 RepID=UPI0024BE4745|nr:BCL-6 corepressor-like protein 1 isoform X2 [Pseudoliparis swirei]
MQVDPTLMNVGDGGTVSREISAPNKASASMVGNPPQTLPPEFRGDVTLSQQNKTTPSTDCKAAKACLDTSNYNHSPELSPPQQLNNAPTAGSEKRADKRAEAPKLKADGAGVCPASQWSGGVKVGRDGSLSPCHSNVTSGKNKKSHPQPQSVQSVPPAFQCSAKFKPAQPVTFLPSTNFPSPLCKITLPPALGQIAALREATASQFQKEIQPQSSGVGGAPLMRTYPYPFSVGRTPAAEKKAGTSSAKLKSNHSSIKNSKSTGEQISLASVVASAALALPLQHPSLTPAAPTRYTLSPTAAICCGSALASITSQSRLLNHVEKSNSIDKPTMGSLKTTPPSASEDHTACSAEPRDIPLDLSARSKRPKCINDPPVPTSESHNNESNQRDFLNSQRAHSAAFSSAVQYPILPNTHRNGSHQKQLNRPQNHQVQESKPTWGKGSSQDSIKNIPGTYVGVASPILASTLRGKDGKGTFADEFQSFAKQEFISIIDQGEHLASGGKKPSCLMKGTQHAHSGKHVKNTSIAITKSCPSKGALTTALSSSANAHTPQKSGAGKAAVPHSASVVSPAWQQPPDTPHQAAPVKRKIPRGSPKTKGTAASEGSTAQSAYRSPTNPEDDKWERMKSPLSNLASIVKQQALDTTAPAVEGNTEASPVASRRADVLNPLSGGQDTQPKQASAFEYPAYWSLEKWAGSPSRGDSTPAKKKPEKANATEPSENNTELNTGQGEHVGLPAKQGFSKPAGHLFGIASTNGNRLESKLAQVLEGEMLKKDISDAPPSKKLDGMVASILTGQCATGGDKFEKKTNGTKEELPPKAKAAAVKQKKTSPKKPAKEKSPPDSSKKAAGKKKRDVEDLLTKVSCQKKKKQCAPVQERSPSAGKVSPPSKAPTPRDKISPNKVEQSARSTSDSSSSALEPPEPLGRSATSSKETDATGSRIPRLRRGRRRADEARLDLWGFATPSPPPPQIPPPPVSPSPPMISTQPTRRPRGRPRSTPLPERATQGKGQAAGAEGETPAPKKRRRCRSKKYQTGDYITEKDKLEDGEHLEEAGSLRRDSGVPADPQADECSSPTSCSPGPPPKRPSFTRSGSVRYQESDVSPECNDKPSGKRKFKSKHLSDNDEPKIKTKRSGSGKRAAPVALENDCADVKKTESLPSAPKSLPSTPPNKKGSSGKISSSESPPKRPVPPEVRRLIVNKNAGETLLQRAARLGYQDVVQYCLEKDISEVNRRDNAGYTALHEASSRGWTQIVQMLLRHGADVNCSAQDGTRPLHDAVASDNLPIVWLLLNHGADPTLATYSGHTPVKLAHSPGMKTFLTEYFTDLEGRKEQDLGSPWDFYSSSLFETDQEPCWDFLLSEQDRELEEDATGKTETDSGKDCLLFEFSSEPLLPCYHVQVSLTQGFCNWLLLTDVVKRLKMSPRIFRARYPHLEVVSLPRAELLKQVSISQVSATLASPHKGKNNNEEEEEEEKEEGEAGLVDLVRCTPELQRLLGSSIDILQEEEEEDEDEEETLRNTGKPRSR